MLKFTELQKSQIKELVNTYVILFGTCLTRNTKEPPSIWKDIYSLYSFLFRPSFLMKYCEWTRDVKCPTKMIRDNCTITFTQYLCDYILYGIIHLGFMNRLRTNKIVLVTDFWHFCGFTWLSNVLGFILEICIKSSFTFMIWQGIRSKPFWF